MEKTYSAWHYTILALKTLGLYSTSKTKRIVISLLLFIIPLIFSIFTALIQFPNMHGDVFQLVKNLEALIAYLHVLGKVSVILIKHEELTKLLEKTERFWKTNVCPDHIKIKLDKLSNNARIIERVFIYCVVISVSGMVIYSIIEGKLVFGIWNLNEYEVLYKWTLLLQQIVVVPIGAFTVCIFDCIFFAICMQTILQFKILCYCLSDLSLSKVIIEDDQQKYLHKLKLYIEHHNFLLKFLRDLQNYYSPALTVECVTIGSLICADMYAILDSNHLDQFVRNLLVCFTQIFELAFYCIVADAVSSEALAVGDAVYNSEWYSNYFTTLGKPITLLIQKSQQPVIFTAGGLFDIKATTVLTVLRLSWSACTVMRGLKEKK